MLTYLYLLIGIALNAAASYTTKLLASGGEGLLAITTLKNPLFWLMLACYGASIFSYMLFLQKVPLAIAYPVWVGGSFAIILVLSFLLLKEALSLPQIAGITLIFIGIVLAVR